MHLGGIRTALFNYLFAKHAGGTFTLRLEDTDRERFDPSATDQITKSLKWLGLDWDEGIGVGGPHQPYEQSERIAIYKEHAQKLQDTGALYRCYCSPERLEKLRHEAQSTKTAFKYDRHCLNKPSEVQDSYVLRFKIPDGQAVSWDDAVKGTLKFEAADQDDFVCIKSDGFPTYNFANVVDDHLMKISHVLRADEFVASTPKHIWLYQAFGWKPPIFAHLPQVLGADKAKLSKRHGAEPVLSYQASGYLPQAIINFLASLGWNEGDGSTKEMYTTQELIQAFSLERIQKSPAVFDAERLKWLNGLYIRLLNPTELLAEAKPFWPESATTTSDEYKLQVLDLVRERLEYLSKLADLTEFFFTDPSPDPEAVLAQSPDATSIIQAAIKTLQESMFEIEKLESVLRGLADKLGLSTKEVFGVLRVSITGKRAAPGLFETMAVLGSETTLRRLEAAGSALSR